MISVASSLASMNILTASVCFLVAATMMRDAYRRDVSDDAAIMMVGIALFAGGWGIQRMYWAVNRSLESLGNDYLLTTLYKDTSWITLIPLAMVVLGGAFLLEPLLSRLFGKAYLIKYLGVAFSIWISGALLL